MQADGHQPAGVLPMTEEVRRHASSGIQPATKKAEHPAEGDGGRSGAGHLDSQGAAPIDRGRAAMPDGGSRVSSHVYTESISPSVIGGSAKSSDCGGAMQHTLNRFTIVSAGTFRTGFQIIPLFSMDIELL